MANPPPSGTPSNPEEPAEAPAAEAPASATADATTLACHGPEEALQPEVRAALDQRYPEDRATGYAAGDLRGAFWAEVPLAGG
jgi:hypothetical protein